MFEIDLTYLEDHGSASLTVLELNVVSDQGLAVNESCLDVVLLVDVLGHWHGR